MLKTLTQSQALRRSKLRLRGETIAHLTSRQLHAVVGGGQDTLLACSVGCPSADDYCPVSQVGPCDPKSVICPIG